MSLEQDLAEVRHHITSRNLQGLLEISQMISIIIVREGSLSSGLHTRLHDGVAGATLRVWLLAIRAVVFEHMDDQRAVLFPARQMLLAQINSSVSQLEHGGFR